MTHKRVVAGVIFIWVLSVFLSVMSLWVPPFIRSLFLCIVIVVGILLIAVVYIKIYLAVQRHQNQIQVLQIQQVAQTGEMANFASLIKSAIDTSYAYLVFLVCYLPYFITLTTLEILSPSIALNRLYFFSLTLLFLNSSLNPVIYCWKMRHIRHAIMDILRNTSWLGNRASL